MILCIVLNYFDYDRYFEQIYLIKYLKMSSRQRDRGTATSEMDSPRGDTCVTVAAAESEEGCRNRKRL